MKKLGWNYWVALVLVVVGLVFIFWGAHIYMSYPGLKDLMKLARHTAHVQYLIGLSCLIVGWIVLTYLKVKLKKKK
jgi:drug/metabolite transporter (DMT)-like permease